MFGRVSLPRGKMGLSICVYLSGLLLTCAGLHVLGPSGPLTVKLGGSLMLPCYTETIIPLEELEVDWMRVDSQSLVHLFQDGEIRPDSQNPAYSGRASFFTEEIERGNFSLLLTNITAEDAGVYYCSVYRQDESGQTSVQINIEHLTVTGGQVISAYAGEAVTLNCSVDSHIPPEEMEEVSWKKMDEDILVLMVQEGEVKTESAHVRYMDRVEFFSHDEIHKGNFSLRVKDLRTEDKGLYMCEVFSGNFSANATVEVQQLGFSSMHIGVLFLCILAFAFPVFLSYHAYIYLKRKDYGRTALSVQCALVISPNVALFIAFILWGLIEGFFTEAATCSALNLLRIGFLFWTAPYLSTFQVHACKFIKHSAIALEYAVITTAAYSGLVLRLCQLYQEKQKLEMMFFVILLTIPLLLLYISIIHQGITKTNRGILHYTLATYINILRGSFVVVLYGHDLEFLMIAFPQLLLYLVIGFWDTCFTRKDRIFVFMLISVLILDVVTTSISVYLHNVKVDTYKERVGLICVTVFLHILTMMLLFPVLCFTFGFGFTVTEMQQTSGNVVMYMFGTVAPVCVNSIALAVELILKARNGERTVEDLRVILIPSECVFALCCFTLQISQFCWKHRVIWFYILRICGCKRTSEDSQEHNHALEALQPTEATAALQPTEATPALQSTEAASAPQSTDAAPALQELDS